MSSPLSYRFSFGPWNISEGADPFGPDVRPAFPHEGKFALYKPLGFDGVQFHDDDVVADLTRLAPAQIFQKAGEVGQMLKSEGSCRNSWRREGRFGGYGDGSVGVFGGHTSFGDPRRFEVAVKSHRHSSRWVKFSLR